MYLIPRCVEETFLKINATSALIIQIYVSFLKWVCSGLCVSLYIFTWWLKAFCCRPGFPEAVCVSMGNDKKNKKILPGGLKKTLQADYHRKSFWIFKWKEASSFMKNSHVDV